jgi:LAS superfamily LD-carboxypeptidase LdcB
MKHKNFLPYIALAFAILLGFSIYSYARIHSLTSQLSLTAEQVRSLDARLASTTAQQSEISNLTTEEFKRVRASITYVEQKVGVYREQIGTVSSTVSNLEKLSKTDPQLLVKYSKVFFLSENYAPARIAEIPAAYRYSQTKAVSVQADVLPKLQAMLDAAKKDGHTILVSSGYRPFAEQKNLKSDYRITYGAGTANQFSADQGYSEHQLGTTVDFTTPELKGELDGFDKTMAYGWLLTNAYKFGFILSYPPNNDYFQFEPWHWRFVGTKLANDLRTAGAHFYDWDQRKIDTYLISIFE